MSCYVVWDEIVRGGQSRALCGAAVLETDIANEPTCLECQRRLSQTAEELFGAPLLRAARWTAVKPAAIHVADTPTKRRGAA